MGGVVKQGSEKSYNTRLGFRDARKYTKLTVVVLGTGRREEGIQTRSFNGKDTFFTGYPGIHLDLFTMYMYHLVKIEKHFNNYKDN